jgi:subtilase family serine protease
MSRRTLALVVLAIGSTALAPTLASAAPSPNGAVHAKSVCAQAPAGYARCNSKVVTRADGVTPSATATYQSGYAPADLVQAYSIPRNGSTNTIAIVDAFASPTAQADLNAYRSQFGLGPTTITQFNQTGGTTLPAGDTGWGQEEALDLDMASAACPTCAIVYVGGNSASFADLSAAVKTAAAKGAKVISNSYGGSEYSSEVTAQAAYNQPGIAVTVSSGDSGYGAQFPASSQYVVDVGGTNLARSGTARGFTETAWTGGGSGCSAYVAKPTWQHDTGCAKRMGSDISAVADPATGVAVYDSYGSTGGANWLVFGGTSVAAPLVGGMYAVAGVTTTYPAATLYAAAPSLYDVVSGSNGSCRRKPAYFCNAGTGYDGPTGNGTPNGVSSLH